MLSISYLFFDNLMCWSDATPFNSDLFFWALLFGSIAALIDGSLGMAYGVTGIAFLLGYGISPEA